MSAWLVIEPSRREIKSVVKGPHRGTLSERRMHYHTTPAADAPICGPCKHKNSAVDVESLRRDYFFFGPQDGATTVIASFASTGFANFGSMRVSPAITGMLQSTAGPGCWRGTFGVGETGLVSPRRPGVIVTICQPSSCDGFSGAGVGVMTVGS